SQNPYEITIITNDKGIRRRIRPSGAKYEAVEVFLSREFKQKNIKRAWEHSNASCCCHSERSEESTLVGCFSRFAHPA
ncbi:MAG: hypothetical protein LE178_06320, partial [Endomicrobium sp.]|nr:hypothetical protein [Endomicrobium sp.]